MFGKYFASTFTGSMLGAGSTVFAVWGYVIAHCRQDGRVELNPQLVAMQLGDTEEKVQAAVDFLCAPDPKSRNKDNEGRRMIQEGSFLYSVPNHPIYRGIANEEMRREVQRLDMQKRRQKDKEAAVLEKDVSPTVCDKSPSVPDVSPTVCDKLTMLTHTEAEAEAEGIEELRSSCSEPSRASEPKEEALLVFPCAGKVKSWPLTQSKVSEWEESFPAMDVMACCRHARQWVIDNPKKKKTPQGMPTFISGWIARAQNAGKNLRSTGSHTHQASDGETFIVVETDHMAGLRQMRERELAASEEPQLV